VRFVFTLEMLRLFLSNPNACDQTKSQPEYLAGQAGSENRCARTENARQGAAGRENRPVFNGCALKIKIARWYALIRPQGPPFCRRLVVRSERLCARLCIRNLANSARDDNQPRLYDFLTPRS